MNIQTITSCADLLLTPADNNLLLSTIRIDQVDTRASQIAQRIFSTHYAKLFEIENGCSVEISDLLKEKNALEKTWRYYLFNGSYTCGLPRYYEICVIKALALGCLGTGLFIKGEVASGTVLLILAMLGSIEAAIPSSLQCQTNVLKSLNLILSDISNVLTKKRRVLQLIIFTHVFAKFCDKWPQMIEKIQNEDYKKPFEMLKGILEEYDSDIVEIAGKRFLHLAPLFLMEKVCTLSPTGQLANSWKHIKATPELWENDDLWEKVQLKTPSGTDYIDFFKVVNKLNAADPSRWGEWFSKKLEIYIEKSKIFGSI